MNYYSSFIPWDEEKKNFPRNLHCIPKFEIKLGASKFRLKRSVVEVKSDMCSLDEKELLIVQKFRKRVTDVVPQENLHNDYWLIRWLRARDLDLEKAELMLRKSMAWYKRNEIDAISTWKPIHNYLRYAVPGTDRDGSPVFLLPMGLWDMREIVDTGDVIPGFRSVLRLLVRVDYEIRASSKRLEKPVNQIVAIFDFQQFSYRQLNSRTVCQGAIEFFRIFESNYPEILKTCFFINTPRIFPIFFAILKPFLSAKTMSKMVFFGPQKTKWTRALVEKIPDEILPPYYGGTRPGTDEFCSEEGIWNDGPLPPNYYGADMSKGRNSIYELNSGLAIQNGNKRFSCFDNNGTMPIFSREEIPAGSKLELEFHVLQEKLEGSYPPTILLKWKIKSDSYDIAFQVTYKDAQGLRREDLIENHRIESHVCQQDGSIVCDKPGTYIVTLDNTFSKRRKKVIYYNIQMEELVDDQIIS